MPLPSSINDLSQTAGSNSPAGSESPALIDDYLRTYASYIALLRDQNNTATVAIASATLTDIGSATSNSINITGTTTITGLGTAAAGVKRTVVFSGSLILTHSSAIVLPGALNITTALNDSAEFLSAGSGNWICTRYTLANTKPAPVVGTVSQSGGATNGAIMETGTNASGTYTKYADGTMICRRTVDYGGVTISTVSGSLFASALQSAASFASAFSAFPTCHIAVISSGGTAFAGTTALPSTTASQAFYVLAPASGAQNITVVIIAVGRWF